MEERDPRASRAGHPGEGSPDQALCVPGYRDGSLTDEELIEALRAVADVLDQMPQMIGSPPVSDEDAELVREAARRLEEDDVDRLQSRVGAAVMDSLQDQAPDIWLEVGTAIATDEGVRDLIREEVAP